jgi:hypothetical protein
LEQSNGFAVQIPHDIVGKFVQCSLLTVTPGAISQTAALTGAIRAEKNRIN